MSDWIKVSYREPEEGVAIIAYIPEVDDETVFMGWRGSEISGVKVSLFWFDKNPPEWFEWKYVTHWMPCPEPPK